MAVQEKQVLFGNLLDSFNVSPKTVTFLLIPEKGDISQADLWRSFTQTYEGSPLSQFGRRAPGAYCKDTLIPRGLVEPTYGIFRRKEAIMGLHHTEIGSTYGIGAATLALYYERLNGVSLYPILGTTRSLTEEDQGAPLNRANILLALHSSPKLTTEKEIAKTTEVSHMVAQASLRALRRAKLLTFKSFSNYSLEGVVQVADITYEKGSLPPESVQPYENPTTLGKNIRMTDAVVEACESINAHEGNINTDQVLEKVSANLTPNQSKKSHRDLIQKILTDLARQKYLEKGVLTGGENQIYSDVRLLPSGIALVTDLLKPYQTLVNDPTTFSREYRGIVSDVLSDLKGFAKDTGEIYAPLAKGIRRINSQENTDELFEWIEMADDLGMSTEDLVELSGFSRTTINHWLRRAGEKGNLVKETRKGIDYYTSAPKQEQ